MPTEWLKRVSMIWEPPVLDAKGRPRGWVPAEVIREHWGRYQIVFNGMDVTFWRDVPTQIETFSFADPFDDETAVFVFPQITPFEAMPDFIFDQALVEINLQRANGTGQRMWEGQCDIDNDSVSDRGYECRIECKGALYQLDNYLAQPPLYATEPRDVGRIIAEQFRQDTHPGLRTTDMFPGDTGIKSNKAGAWNPALTGFVADLLALATLNDGSNKYTVSKLSGRVPILHLKSDFPDWSVYCGSPGVEHELTRDWTAAASVYYGEGIDAANCRWRNAKYPSINDEGPPIFPGTIMDPGVAEGEDVLMFEYALAAQGYPITVDGVYSAEEEEVVKSFQRNAGITVDGSVGPQTWAALFEPGSSDPDGAFFYPLAWVNAAMPYFVNGQGQKIPNPEYDSEFPRKERYVNFGSQTPITEGVESSIGQLVVNHPGDYIGTITLTADPEEGSRYEIHAGQNITFKGHRGADRFLHIAHCEVDMTEGKVTLTVDEGRRDFLTLHDIIERNRENSNPSWRQEVRYRNSKQTEDTFPTWDCESNSGIVPRHATYSGLWNVLRIPCAAGGTVARTEFRTDEAARYAVAVFDRPITAEELAPFGSPLDDPPEDEFGFTHGGFFDQFDDLVIAWGESGQAAGYSPGSESDDNEPNGVLIDNAQWYFESQKAPYLWVCIWVDPGTGPTINYIQGRLFPGAFG